MVRIIHFFISNNKIYSALGFLFLFTISMIVSAHAIPDGAGNEVFPATNIGIGTTTPQAALVITNGNVGIGTWTASQILDVKGNIAATGTISGAVISGVISPSTLEVTGQTTLNTSSGNTGIGTTLTGGSTARLAVIGGNVGIGTITPQGALVVTNGNVGIGTWNPSAMFDLRGNLGIGTSVSSPTMIINGRNVGIGTLSPASIFDVNGGTAVSNVAGYAIRLVAQDGSNADGGRVYLASGNNTSASMTSGASLTLTGGVGATQGGGSISLTAGNGNNNASPGNVSVTAGSTANNGGGYVQLIGGDGYNGYGGSVMISGGGAYSANVRTGSVLLGVESTGIIRTNVGIGTNATRSLLDVSAENLGSSPLAFTSGSNLGIGTWLPVSKLGIVGNVGIGTIRYSSFVLNTAPTGGMIVEGNVGLGTTTPQAKFVSMGNVGIGTWTSSNNRLTVYGATAHGTTASFVSTAAPTGGMIIEGNVGIGTFSPQTGFVSMNNVGIGTWTAANGRLVIQGGNVGIGTALVPTTLSVKGSYSQIVNTLTDAATIATDASLGNHFRVTLGGNRTLGNPSNATDGQRIVWEFIQDGTGSRTITLGSSFGLGSDVSAVTLTTTANKRDFMTGIYNVGVGSWYVVGFVKGY